MRVAALTTFHEPCGIATYSEALLAALRAEGVAVDVIAPTLRAGTEPRGEQPPRRWRRDRASFGEGLQVFRDVVRLKADVVHLQLSLGFVSVRFLAALAQACRVAGLPVVVTLHDRSGDGLLRNLRLARTLAALRGATLVVHNGSHASEAQRHAGSVVRVIPHGIAAPLPRDGAACKRALGVPSERPVIAHFGFIHPDKGIEAVLHAVAALRARGQLVHYLVCGGAFPTGVSQAHLRHLRAEATRLGVAEQVSLEGIFLDDAQVSERLGAADLIVLNYQTGHAQTSSGAARHAFTAGRPIVVSSAPIFDDLRGSLYTLRASPGSPAALADELACLLADDALRAKLASAVTVRADADSWPSVARQHIDLFSELLGSQV
ncbi:MAG: glycosyltransferase [Polyangiaceae bacterium]|nr:glycosyltransferase [Polyangiaceae bacterium]MCW5790294.1 glycosyltransferase [Polyangiaceae bacterium]